MFCSASYTRSCGRRTAACRSPRPHHVLSGYIHADLPPLLHLSILLFTIIHCLSYSIYMQGIQLLGYVNCYFIHFAINYLDCWLCCRSFLRQQWSLWWRQSTHRRVATFFSGGFQPEIKASAHFQWLCCKKMKQGSPLTPLGPRHISEVFMENATETADIQSNPIRSWLAAANPVNQQLKSVLFTTNAKSSTLPCWYNYRLNEWSLENPRPDLQYGVWMRVTRNRGTITSDVGLGNVLVSFCFFKLI